LFAPPEHRGALHALYAFNLEIARVREIVHEPLAGEIRMQWWRDAIAGRDAGEASAHPVAAALAATMARYRLAAQRLSDLIDARRFDLYNDPMPGLAELEDYASKTSSALIGLAANILGGGRDAAAVDHLALHAGVGYAIAVLLKSLPAHAARGQLFLPLDLLDRHGARREDIFAKQATPGLRSALAELRQRAREHLAKARGLVESAPATVLPAILPVASAGLLLGRLEAGERDPFAPVEVAQWRRQWRLWRAARRPELIFSCANSRT
jgi:phytoene synthase